LRHEMWRLPASHRINRSAESLLDAGNLGEALA
jgi:hypothetical protein